MQNFVKIFLSLIAFFFLTNGYGQQDSSVVLMKNFEKKTTTTQKIKKDSSDKNGPRIATIRSAIFPGLGQIYNKKYWKLPLVYGSLGVTAGIFFYNVKTYNQLKAAYILMLMGADSAVDPRFRYLSPQAVQSYRNSFRQNVDYSVLAFILFWGLNVVDAYVDASLKSFNVNDNLTLQLKPCYSPLAGTSGISLVLNISKNNAKALTSLP